VVPAPPLDIQAVPDAVPRIEPRSALGNPPFYDEMGRRYYVLSTANGYLETGVASWYGPSFHEKSTSSGELYDMYGMTAAHKTLPLPTYARVTNLKNGRSVVVRINDRGPFIANRLIDLSYTAAAKLDMLREGTTLVEVRALAPERPEVLPVAPAAAGAFYLQAGAFADPRNAQRVLARLRDAGVDGAFVVEPPAGGDALFRVRVGPLGSVEELDQWAGRLTELGFADARVVRTD
jgi:rare lipoprotein A